MAFERITIKHDGVYREWGNQEHPLDELDIALAESGMELMPRITDEQVMTAISISLGGDGTPVDLSNFVIDPPESERLAGQHDEKTVLNLRPPATFGYKKRTKSPIGKSLSGFFLKNR